MHNREPKSCKPPRPQPHQGSVGRTQTILPHRYPTPQPTGPEVSKAYASVEDTTGHPHPIYTFISFYIIVIFLILFLPYCAIESCFYQYKDLVFFAK